MNDRPLKLPSSYKRANVKDTQDCFKLCNSQKSCTHSSQIIKKENFSTFKHQQAKKKNSLNSVIPKNLVHIFLKKLKRKIFKNSNINKPKKKKHIKDFARENF